MGSAVAKAKTRPASWSAWEKIEPFTAEVKAHLEHLQAARGVKVFPREPLSGGRLDKALMAIWLGCAMPACNGAPSGSRSAFPSALNMLKRARPDISVRRKRKRSGWSNDFARSILGQMR